MYDGRTDLGATTSNSSGAWTYTTGPLSSGSQSFTAKATVNSGLTLKSSYLTLTATNGTSSAALTTTASQTLIVSDPPSQVSAGASLDLARILFGGNTALGYSEHGAGTGARFAAREGIHAAALGQLIQYAAAGFNNLSDNRGGGAFGAYLEPAWSLTAHPSSTASSLIRP